MKGMFSESDISAMRKITKNQTMKLSKTDVLAITLVVSNVVLLAFGYPF
jgi:hypothetical protein